MRRSRILVLAGIAGAAALTACASVFGFDDLTSDAFDAGHDASADTGSGTKDSGANNDADASGDPCGQVGIPDPPTTDSPSPDGGDITFVTAMDYMDLGITPDGGGTASPVGFNLDRFCTVGVAANSCNAQTSNLQAYDSYVVDKTTGGMDNAGFPLIQYLGSIGQTFMPESINSRLQMGQFGAILKVVGYNGAANDKSVVVNFFPAVGLLGASGTVPVVFSHADSWIVDNSTVLVGPTGPPFSKYVDQTAYVTGGKLVAHFTFAEFSVSVSDPDPRLVLSLNDVVVTADIVPSTNGSSSVFRLTNGVLGGRWPTRAFFAAVAPLTLLGNPVCQQATVLDALSSTVCVARDIMSADGLDNDTPPQTCDSVSAGLAFDTYAVDGFTTGPAPTSTDAGCPDVGDCP